MIICERHRMVYLAPPKTGSVTVLRTLQEPPFHGETIGKRYDHHNTVWEERFRDWFFFTTVRHPYERMVSLWRFACKEIRTPEAPWRQGGNWWPRYFRGQAPSFEGFLNDRRLWRIFHNVWRCSWHIERIPRFVDEVIYMEHFEELYRKVPGLQGVQARHENPGPERTGPWWKYHTPATLRRTAEFWEEDFRMFGYNPNVEECKRGEIFV